MTMIKNGQLSASPEVAKHLRSKKRSFWKRERQAGTAEVAACPRSHTPNAQTIAAIQEARTGSLKSFASAEDMFKALNAGD